MPSLKTFRNRIASVKATRKITRAMQMVAASKLKRAQDAAQAARPYAEKMAAVIASLAGSLAGNPTACVLLGQRNEQQVDAAAECGDPLNPTDVTWVRQLYRS